MKTALIEPGWQLIAWFFSYPELSRPAPVPPVQTAESARKLILQRQQIELVSLQNEYTRLFINSLPQVPCAPYGSVYLEGMVMGQSTIELADIYRTYGLVADEELADHIAVECQFLDWLSIEANRSVKARNDYEKVVAHLQCWAPAFLECVIQHDWLGWFAKAADLAQNWIFPEKAKPALPEIC